MSNILQNNDLIFYKSDNGNIMSGGYDVESHMLRNGISPMKTLNFEQNGGKEKKVSNRFENLAVPAGLYYITQSQSKTKHKEQNNYDKEHTPLPDDIFDKLYEMIEYSDKNKRKTKKQDLNLAKKHKKTKKQSSK
jgi:hydroxylamine reductase (hybrid-cluster protein)